MTQLNEYTGNFELEFERPLTALERQIDELEAQNDPNRSAMGLDPNVDLGAEIRKLRQSHTAMLKKIYKGLSAGNTVKVARHPGRPQSMDYIHGFVKDFAELHGDRHYGDDHAIRCGFGRTADFSQVIGFDLDYYGYGYPAIWLEYARYSYTYYYPLYYNYGPNAISVDTSAGTAEWRYGYVDYPQGDGTFYTYYIQAAVSFY